MLAADLVGFRRAQELAQRRDRPIQHIHTFHQQGGAACDQLLAQAWLARVKNTSPGAMAI